MDEKYYTEAVLDEIKDCLMKITKPEIEALTGQIDPDIRIFCDAAGRSRLQMEGFAMRLAQMGFKVYIVGEPTAPAIEAGDVLVTASASGETPVLVQHSRKAKEIGAKRLLITASPESSLGLMSDSMLILHAQSKTDTRKVSMQPMGSLFEQCLMLIFDIIVLCLMDKYGISGEDMYEHHANLE